MPRVIAAAYTSLTRYDFLIVLIGVVVGMSLTKIIAFFGALFSHRHVYRLHWIPVLYLVVLFVAQVHYWWGLWQAEQLMEVQFVEFLQLLALPIIYYLCSALLCPECDGDSCDLFAHFNQHARLLYVIFAVGILVGVLQGVFTWHVSVWDRTMIVRYLAIALFVPGIWKPSQRYHSRLVLAACLLFVLYLGLSS